jgi:ABC-2 type transport system permease protein
MTRLRVVAAQELRDLWLTGRGLPLILAYAVLLSVTSYLVASNQALNFLEQREAVSLTLQVGVGVAALLVLVVSADAISGERERGTLESLLLTPAPRWVLLAGKGLAAMSLWLVAYVVSVPYIWYLARGTGVLGRALVAGLGVGTLIVLFLCSLGLAISAVTGSNRVALSVSFFLLLAAFFPTQLPTAAQSGGVADFLLRVDPVTAGLHYLSELVVRGRPAGEDVGWLVGPIVLAVAAAAAACTVGARMSLRPGRRA